MQTSTITSSVDDEYEGFLSSVDSIDDGDGELPPLGISGEGFDGVLPLSSEDSDVVLTPRPTYGGLPQTPPTTKPIYNILPPIISPSELGIADDSEDTLSPPSPTIDDVFRPPSAAKRKLTMGTTSTGIPNIQTDPEMKKNASKKRKICTGNAPHNPIHGDDNFERLIECMRHSHSSRSDILRCRSFFEGHPSFREMERLVDSRRRIWDYFVEGRRNYSNHS